MADDGDENTFGGLAVERKGAAEWGPRATETVAKLLEATKTVFLGRGFDGTTVDEITQVAGVSRASFYTYFPSKREALLALGSRSVRNANSMLRALRALPRHPAVDDVHRWVQEFFAVLDETGSFSVAWSQAAFRDAELRSLGLQEHLRLSEAIGHALGDLRAQPFDEPVAQGFLLQCQIERAWSYCALYGDPALTAVVQRELAANLCAVLAAGDGTRDAPPAT
jgi:TetR/AcrR family transcriptional regulator